MVQKEKPNLLAIFSLVAGILSVVCSCAWYFSILFGVAAVVMGIISLRGNIEKLKDLATVGVVVGATGIALSVAVAIVNIMIYSGISTEILSR